MTVLEKRERDTRGVKNSEYRMSGDDCLDEGNLVERMNQRESAGLSRDSLLRRVFQVFIVNSFSDKSLLVHRRSQSQRGIRRIDVRRIAILSIHPLSSITSSCFSMHSLASFFFSFSLRCGTENIFFIVYGYPSLARSSNCHSEECHRNTSTSWLEFFVPTVFSEIYESLRQRMLRVRTLTGSISPHQFSFHTIKQYSF